MTNFVIFKGKKKTDGISPFDRGFALGDGVFETIKVAGSRAVWLDEHLDRMTRSAQFAGIRMHLDKNEIVSACNEYLAENSISDGIMRLTLTRGETMSGRFSEIPETSTLVIAGNSSEDNYPPLKAAFAEWPINEADPSVKHKTTSKISQVLAWNNVKKRGMDEVLFLNTKGFVAEGSISNVFWFKSGVLCTPAEECGILGGITRKKVLKAAKKLGISLDVGNHPAFTIPKAQGLFFTNSLWMVRPCKEFNGVGMEGMEDKIHRLREIVLNDKGDL